VIVNFEHPRLVGRAEGQALAKGAINQNICAATSSVIFLKPVELKYLFRPNSRFPITDEQARTLNDRIFANYQDPRWFHEVVTNMGARSPNTAPPHEPGAQLLLLTRCGCSAADWFL
jgi:hypothetical protein